MPFTLFEGTEAIGTTEHSCTTDTSGPDTDTTEGIVEALFDVSDMVGGDELQIRIYEKARSGDTQRIVDQIILTGPQGSPIFRIPPIALKHGWDFTLDALAGTITVQWSLRLDAGGGLDAAGVRAALGMSSANLDTQLGAIDDFLDSEIAAILAAVDTEIAAILADTNELQTDWANGGRLDLLIDAILADTNELQTDWVNGGRLDNILDARASQTSVDDLPTNAELATALGTADDAVLAALAVVDGIVDAIKLVTDKLDDVLEDDGGTYRFTANALEQGPVDGAGPTAEEIADAVWDEDLTEHAVADSTGEALTDAAAGGGGGTDWTADERTAIRSILGIPGSGTTPADPSTGILDTIRDSVATRASQASVDDLPTNAELATALAAADDAILAQVALVKAQTDLLPSDPADASVVAGLIAALDAKVDTIDNFLDTEIAAILEDTSTTIDDLVDDLEGRLTAALATKLAAHAAGVLVAVIDAGSTPTAVVLKTVEGAAASGTNDFYNGAVLIFTSGALAGQRTSIADYVGATKTLTVPALTGAPAENVTALIV